MKVNIRLAAACALALATSWAVHSQDKKVEAETASRLLFDNAIDDGPAVRAKLVRWRPAESASCSARSASCGSWICRTASHGASRI